VQVSDSAWLAGVLPLPTLRAMVVGENVKNGVVMGGDSLGALRGLMATLAVEISIVLAGALAWQLLQIMQVGW
jgi:hypothetical protein